ncbi:hypothetical protein AAFF_G00419050 [Aldrovandia affinis]|uniref:Uncharacterized protein n=1 Tax=Aldrovandia affinis TaxID=143900 RepID=A0AAD7SA81_9TELE|nr:hypothetical protein AAFF_G00419050 [Aldrovandia affinis]
MSVQDFSHRQTPKSTSPVEVTHHSWRATSTHPVPPDSSGHPRGSHHQRASTREIEGGHWRKNLATALNVLLVKLVYSTSSGTLGTLLPPPATGACISSRLTYSYLPPHKKRKTALVRASLARAGTGKTYARWRSSGRSTDLTTTTFPVSDSCRRDHTPSLLRTRAIRASQFLAALPRAQNRTPKIWSPPSHTAKPPESPMSSVHLPQNRTEDFAIFTLEPVPAPKRSVRARMRPSDRIDDTNSVVSSAYCWIFRTSPAAPRSQTPSTPGSGGQESCLRRRVAGPPTEELGVVRLCHSQHRRPFSQVPIHPPQSCNGGGTPTHPGGLEEVGRGPLSLLQLTEPIGRVQRPVGVNQGEVPHYLRERSGRVVCATFARPIPPI